MARGVVVKVGSSADKNATTLFGVEKTKVQMQLDQASAKLLSSDKKVVRTSLPHAAAINEANQVTEH